MEFFLVLSQLLFLMCYNIYFGTQADQLMCKTYEVADCGYQKTWATLINVAMLPILFQRKMSSIGYFSIVSLIFTVMSFLLITYECISIMNLKIDESTDTNTYHNHENTLIANK